MPQNIENKEGHQPFLSRLRTSKLFRKGTLGLSALLAAVTIEATSPSLEQILNRNTSTAYAAEPTEVRYESGFLYAIGEGKYQGTIGLSGEDTIEKAKQKAIYDAFEDLGLVHLDIKRGTITKEFTRRETGKQVTSVWTEEWVNKFLTEYPETYSSLRTLNNPEAHYRMHNLEAYVRLELKISEKDYRSFIEEPELQRERLREIELGFTRTSNDLELGYKARTLQRREQEDILKHQEKVRKLEISEQAKEAELKRAEDELEELKRRMGKTDSVLEEKTKLISDILQQLEREEKDPQKLKEYKQRAEDLLQEGLKDRSPTKYVTHLFRELELWTIDQFITDNIVKYGVRKFLDFLGSESGEWYRTHRMSTWAALKLTGDTILDEGLANKICREYGGPELFGRKKNPEFDSLTSSLPHIASKAVSEGFSGESPELIGEKMKVIKNLALSVCNEVVKIPGALIPFLEERQPVISEVLEEYARDLRKRRTVEELVIYLNEVRPAIGAVMDPNFQVNHLRYLATESELWASWEEKDKRDRLRNRLNEIESGLNKLTPDRVASFYVARRISANKTRGKEVVTQLVEGIDYIRGIANNALIRTAH